MDTMYDKNNPLSIEEFAKKLRGHTFQDIIEGTIQSHVSKNYKSVSDVKESYGNVMRKGGLGNLLEKLYFGYEINNNSDADFQSAGVELKVSPYEIKKDGSKRAGERLVLSMISYSKPVDFDFYESHLWKKCRLLLLIYYLRDKKLKSNLMYRIDYVKLFTPPAADLKIIEDDYKVIINKIVSGKAHELSESDTMYLGACTKGSTAEKSTVPQYYNKYVLARKRAFCYKVSYMTSVLNNYIANSKDTFEPIIKDVKDLEKQTFSEYIIRKINSYVGSTDRELCTIFNREYNNNKSQWYDLIFRMLGIKSNNALEFQKANIVVKAIRLNSKGKIVESSPLPQINFLELIKEEWEESALYRYLSETKFLFVIYKQFEDEYVLKGCQLWNMPLSDLNEIVQKGWNDIKRVIIDGVKLYKVKHKNGIVFKNNLPKKKDNSIIHIRPHARKSYYILENGVRFGPGSISDADMLPDGRWIPKQSFWINNTYILSILNKELL